MLAGIVVQVLFEALFPLSLKFIIDRAIIPKDGAALRLILITLGVGGLVFICAAVASDFANVRLTASVINDLRLSIFRHLQGLSIDFYSRVQPGDIVARFSSDLSEVEYAVGYTLHYGLLSLLGVVASLIVLMTLQWRLALLAVAGLPLAFLGPRLVGRRAADATYGLKQEQGRVHEMVNENVNARHVVRAFGLQRTVTEAFRLRLGSLWTLGVRANFLGTMMERTPNLTVVAFNIAVTSVGAWLVFKGSLSIGSLVSFHTVFAVLSTSVAGVTWAFPYLIRAAGGMRRIDEILSEVPVVSDPFEPKPMVPLEREIAFKDVVFGYDSDRINVNGATFTIPRGAHVAIVGPSGSGKSTILSLLLRIYDPLNGSVNADGTDIRSFSQEALRSRFGVVFQENFLFNASVNENMRIVRPDATDADIRSAAKAADVHDTLAGLPQGYDTSVGVNGSRLSRGQCQRIAIARALVRNPDVLVLDEATSALDAASEAAVNSTIERVGRDRTVISVTHRLASVVNADRIIVMDAGAVVAQGTHQELLAQSPLYRDLWNKQMRFAAHDDGKINPSALRALPLFENMQADALERICEILVTEQHPAGNLVIAEGEPGDKLYLISRGKLEVFRRTDDGERRLAIREDGEFFGEIALLESGLRTSSVRTLTPAKLLSLDATAFRNLMVADASVRATIEETARARRGRL